MYYPKIKFILIKIKPKSVKKCLPIICDMAWLIGRVLQLLVLWVKLSTVYNKTGISSTDILVLAELSKTVLQQ